jgi:hypothetical protein
MKTQDFIDKLSIFFKRKKSKNQGDRFSNNHVRENIKITSPSFSDLVFPYQYNPYVSKFNGADFLFCVSRDCWCICDGLDTPVSFDQFCNEAGYSKELISSLETYKICLAHYEMCKYSMRHHFEEFLHLEE